MSIARLAGLVARAAAPAGRLAAGRVAGIETTGADQPALGMPAFDAPASVGSAMLRATLAEAPALPPLRRAGLSPPFVSTKAGSGPLPAVSPSIPMAAPLHRTAAPAPATPVPRTSAIVAPPAQRDTMRSTPSLAGPAAPPALGAAPRLAVSVIATPSPQDPPHAVEPAAGDAAPVASVVIESPRPSMPAMMAGPVLPEAPTAASSAAATTGPPDAAPTIAIGTVEVVIAQAPQRPAAPARSVPDRGFARYAAMRGARDRAW